MRYLSEGRPGGTIIIMSKKAFPVRAIVSEQIVDGERNFEVAWEGDPLEKTTLEPTNYLKNCLEYVIRFVKRATVGKCC